VRARRAKVAVGDGDRQHDRQNVHQKREQQIFGDEGHVDGCRRKNLGDQQQEDDKCQKN